MVIGIGGKAGSGKDTVAKMIEELGYEHRKFATPLYNMIARMLAVTPEWLMDNKDVTFRFPRYGEIVPMTVREILQYVGTDVCRADDEDYFIKLMDLGLLTHYPKNKEIVISDVRFRNELAEIANFGKSIYVKRQQDETSIHTHSSENDVTEKDFNYVLNNDGTLDDLKANLLTLLSNAGLL